MHRSAEPPHSRGVLRGCAVAMQQGGMRHHPGSVRYTTRGLCCAGKFARAIHTLQRRAPVYEPSPSALPSLATHCIVLVMFADPCLPTWFACLTPHLPCYTSLAVRCWRRPWTPHPPLARWALTGLHIACLICTRFHNADTTDCLGIAPAVLRPSILAFSFPVVAFQHINLTRALVAGSPLGSCPASPFYSNTTAIHPYFSLHLYFCRSGAT